MSQKGSFCKYFPWDGCPTLQLLPKLWLYLLPPSTCFSNYLVHFQYSKWHVFSAGALCQGLTHVQSLNLPVKSDESALCLPSSRYWRTGNGKKSALVLEGGNWGGSSPISEDFSAEKSSAVIIQLFLGLNPHHLVLSAHWSVHVISLFPIQRSALGLFSLVLLLLVVVLFLFLALLLARSLRLKRLLRFWL